MEATGLPVTTTAAADTFSLNLSDQRFRSLLSGDPRFGIDPLASEYKATGAMSTILKEQRKRRRLQEQQQQGDGGGDIPPDKLTYSSKDNIANQGNTRESSIKSGQDSQDDGDGGMSHLVNKLKNKFGDKNNSSKADRDDLIKTSSEVYSKAVKNPKRKKTRSKVV